MGHGQRGQRQLDAEPHRRCYASGGSATTRSAERIGQLSELAELLGLDAWRGHRGLDIGNKSQFADIGSEHRTDDVRAIRGFGPADHRANCGIGPRGVLRRPHLPSSGQLSGRLSVCDSNRRSQRRRKRRLGGFIRRRVPSRPAAHLGRYPLHGQPWRRYQRLTVLRHRGRGPVPRL